MSVHNITSDVLQLDFNDPKRRKDFSRFYPKWGLYVMHFDNSSGANIRDRNAIPNNNWQGKVVIPAKSSVIKFGKFENGLIARLYGYYTHLHYEDHQDSVVFKDVLKSLVYVDLDPKSPSETGWNIPRIYEEFWNQAIHSYLHKNEMLLQEQNLRSEYRVINQSADLPRGDIISHDYLRGLEKSIIESYSFLLK